MGAPPGLPERGTVSLFGCAVFSFCCRFVLHGGTFGPFSSSEQGRLVNRPMEPGVYKQGR